MLKNRPAVRFIIPFIIGILMGWKSEIPIYTILICIVCLILIYILLSKYERFQLYLPGILFLILLLFGCLKINFDAKYIVDDNILNYIEDGKNIILLGEVTELPRKSEHSIRFVIKAESLYYNNRPTKVSGGVLAVILQSKIETSVLKMLTYGRIIKLKGELTSVQTARNPGEFDFKNYLNLNGIYALFYPDKIDESDISVNNSQNFKNSFVYPVRRSIAKKLDGFIGGEESKFLKGLIIGERSEIPLEIKTAFINSGVMHILAVSGLHVAIVTLILLVIFQVLRIPEKVRIILTSVLLIYYIFLTGSAPSVTRSVIMAVVFLFGKLLERKSDIYNTLAFSAVIILLIDAKELFQPGFQLSFVAVLSIVYLFPKVYSLREFLPERVREFRIIKIIFSLFSISVAAGIGTLPFVSVYFNKISLISFLANLIIVPLVNVVLALGMLTTILAYVCNWLASIYAEVTSFIAWLLLKCVSFLGSLPFAYIDAKFSLVSLLMFYTIIGVIINFGNREVIKRFVIVFLILLNLWLYSGYIFNDKQHRLSVTFLDVGQGDAIFIEFPDNKTMLVDGGPKTFGMDAGIRFIIPFLKYEHIRKINTIIVTHPDADHLGGIPTIMRYLEVEQIRDTKFNCQTVLCQDYKKVIDSINVTHFIQDHLSAIDLSDTYRVYVLNPSGTSSTNGLYRLQDENNKSIVLKIVFGKTSLLLTGDAEFEAEALMNKRFGDFLRSDILKVAHHGSKNGTSDDYLRYVKPKKAVISVGEKNKFGHPSEEVIERLKKYGCEIIRTDKSGAVIFESDGERWEVINWK